MYLGIHFIRMPPHIEKNCLIVISNISLYICYVYIYNISNIFEFQINYILYIYNYMIINNTLKLYIQNNVIKFNTKEQLFNRRYNSVSFSQNI
jgi:hypothetical protein